MQPTDPEDPLPRILPAWRVSPPRDPGFRPAVWSRIRKSPDETWGAYARSHSRALSVIAILTLTVSAWAGQKAGDAHLHSQREAMVVTYLVDLDPRVQAGLQARQ